MVLVVVGFSVSYDGSYGVKNNVPRAAVMFTIGYITVCLDIVLLLKLRFE